MRLRYTRRAANELDQALSYIEGRPLKGAGHVKARIQTVIDLISVYPQSGQLTSIAGLRRVVVHPFPYIIIYAVSDEEVVIHGVRHTARRRSAPLD